MPPAAAARAGPRAGKAIAKRDAPRITSAQWKSLFDRATAETEQALHAIHSARGEQQDASKALKAAAAAGSEAAGEEGWIDVADSEDDSVAAVGNARRSARRGAVDVRSMWDTFQQGRRTQEREARAKREHERMQREQMKQEQQRAVESAAEAEARKKREREEQRAAERARREAERVGTGIDMMGQANLMKSFESGGGGGGGGGDDFSMDSFG
jgi:DNA polymerase III delta prime subunit